MKLETQSVHPLIVGGGKVRKLGSDDPKVKRIHND